LLRYCNWSGPGKEVEVQDPTKSVVLQVLVLAISVVDLDIHAIGIEEENTVGASGTMLKVYGVIAV